MRTNAMACHMSKLVTIAAGLVFSLAACSDKQLTPNDHFVSITITNDRIDVPVPDPVFVHGSHAVIHWEIKTPGYRFPDDGIVIAAGGDEFTGGHTAEQGRKFQVNDKNRSKNRYKYTVTVLKGSTPLTPLDPTIAND